MNEARVGYVRIDNKAINEPIVTVDDLGINRPNSNLYKTIYKFTFSTFNLGPTPGADQSQLQNNLTFLDTASYTAGKHQLRFGGQYDRVALDKNFPQTFNGELFFFPSAANPLDPTSPCVDGCSDFQNFLLGQPGFSFGGSGVSNHEYRINDYGIFFQDDFKATPNLTINAGFTEPGPHSDRCCSSNMFAASLNAGSSVISLAFGFGIVEGPASICIGGFPTSAGRRCLRLLNRQIEDSSVPLLAFTSRA